jgi:uncharacterized integral membrane protein
MRLIRLLIAVLCLAVGVVVGALNHQPVVIDLGFNTLHATVGVSVLVALLLGALIGGAAVTASVVLPLRRRLRRAANATPIAPASRDGY